MLESAQRQSSRLLYILPWKQESGHAYLVIKDTFDSNEAISLHTKQQMSSSHMQARKGTRTDRDTQTYTHKDRHKHTHRHELEVRNHL